MRVVMDTNVLLVVQDPDDDKFVDCAIAANALYLVLLHRSHWRCWGIFKKISSWEYGFKLIDILFPDSLGRSA